MPQRRKQRLFRLLGGIVVLPTLLGLFSMGATFLGAKIWLARTRPALNPEEWPQVAWIVAAGMLVFVLVQVGGSLLMFRRFLAYRTAKHGRAVALGDVLNPTDLHPSALRRLKLWLLGVRGEELGCVQALRRASGT